MDDYALLRQYVEQSSESAFAALVRRHVRLVYSSALRQMRDPHAAEDVTQAVFTSLARTAHKIRPNQVLCGWLMTSTRYLASHARQSQARRQYHERIAAEMTRTMTDPPKTDLWEQLAPDLDEAIAELAPKSRDAVLLRYFEGKSVREVAAALRISEDAAKQRLSRAMEQLRGMFARKGLTVSPAILGATLSAHAVHDVPAGLAASAASTATKFGKHLVSQKGTAALMAAIKSKVAVSLMVLTIGGTTSVAVHRVLAHANNTPAPAQLGAPAADASWRKHFDEVYSLGDKEMLKRIPPPFIPEREAMFNEIDPKRNMIDTEDDGIILFTWDGKAEFNSWSLGKPTVIAIIRQCVGLPSFKVEMNLKDKLRQVPGDWLKRHGASEDELMESLAKSFREQTGWKIRFEKRKAEHDVIVARGSYTAPANAKDGMVDVFVEGRGGNPSTTAGNVGSFVTQLGELMGTETICEATPADANVFWHSRVGENLSAADARKMLDNIEKQTGLRFTREKRVTAHWVAVPANK